VTTAVNLQIIVEEAMKRLAVALGAVGVVSAGLGLTMAASKAPPPCAGLPSESRLVELLGQAPASGGNAGGLFGGARMWAAVVNRDGELCAYATSTADPSQVWAGGQAIAKAKANTANAFSLDVLPLSTARLYTFVQPGHSLFSLNWSNPFDPTFLAAPDGHAGGLNHLAGGLITFGGGVPLYSGGRVIGGLGISRDTSCTDHEIAKRVRNLAGLNPPGGALVDDIVYPNVDGPSAFGHPLCPNTFRNGVSLGNETPATGY
jgi:uncharacterized protein GlcG (DUF336 family)